VRFLGTTPFEPEPVPDEQVTSLKTLIENKTFLEPYPYLKEGQKVRIKRGSLSGVEGIFVEKYGQHMLVISVDILRKGASLKIDAVEVEAV
jgi:transcription antitermination factor NusG